MTSELTNLYSVLTYLPAAASLEDHKVPLPYNLQPNVYATTSQRGYTSIT